MKELTREHQDTIEIQVEKEHRKEIKLIGRQRKIPGLILWEFNIKTKMLLPASFKKEDVVIVIINQDCIYFQALNRRSAIKKLKTSHP